MVYLPSKPDAGESFYSRALVLEPRLAAVHLGLPGRFALMSGAARNGRMVRRRCVSDVPLHGITSFMDGFMADAGFFDPVPAAFSAPPAAGDGEGAGGGGGGGGGEGGESKSAAAGGAAPGSHAKQALHCFARCRALRALVGSRLGAGKITLDEAAAELSQLMPAPLEQARAEAEGILADVEHSLSYLVGGQEAMKYFAQNLARRRTEGSVEGGPPPSTPLNIVREFHSALIANAYVPIALQQWETCGPSD